MKKTFTLLCLLFSLQAYTQQVKVLFIGNSFIGSNNLPGIFNDMATAAGYNVQVVGHSPGGIFVGDTRQGNDAHANNPHTYDLIRQEKWDYIVVQDNQGFYSWDYGWFPPVADEVNSHKKIRDSAVANNPCARMILFSGWCFKNGWQGSPPTFNTGSEMNQRVFENYCFLNNSLHEIVAPISISWNRIIKNLPHIDLWSSDQAHPSYEGSYLAAATIFATIFKTSPETAMFRGTIDSADARYMRKTAYQAVVDSVAPTMLAKHIVSLTHSSRQLKATAGYTSYKWYRNDTLQRTTTTDTFNIDTTAACYQVVAADAQGCVKKSLVQCVQNTLPPASGIVQYALQQVRIFPNPNDGNGFTISLNTPAQNVLVQLYTITGAVVYSKNFEGGDSNFYISQQPALPQGMYLLKVQTGSGVFTARVQVNGQ